MAFEYAPREKRGLFASYPQIGLCLSTGVVALLSSSLSDADFMRWGWRAAFMLSIVLVGVGLFIRLRGMETPEFARLKDSQRIARAPLVATTLLEYGGHKPWLISLYVLAVGVISSVSTWAMRRTY